MNINYELLKGSLIVFKTINARTNYVQRVFLPKFIIGYSNCDINLCCLNLLGVQINEGSTYITEREKFVFSTDTAKELNCNILECHIYSLSPSSPIVKKQITSPEELDFMLMAAMS